MIRPRQIEGRADGSGPIQVGSDSAQRQLRTVLPFGSQGYSEVYSASNFNGICLCSTLSYSIHLFLAGTN